MPGLIRVSEFVEETREDYNSPTTSTFVSRMPQCRQTITSLEEVNEVHHWLLKEGHRLVHVSLVWTILAYIHVYFDCCYVKIFLWSEHCYCLRFFQQVYGVHFDYSPRKYIVTLICQV